MWTILNPKNNEPEYFDETDDMIIYQNNKTEKAAERIARAARRHRQKLRAWSKKFRAWTCLILGVFLLWGFFWYLTIVHIELQNKEKNKSFLKRFFELFKTKISNVIFFDYEDDNRM